MRSVREIFKSKEYLLDEPEVEKLVEYCEELQDEIVEFKYQKKKTIKNSPCWICSKKL